MSDTVKLAMKVFESENGTSVLEFHKAYGSFVEFNEKIQEIKEALEEIEDNLVGEESE